MSDYRGCCYQNANSKTLCKVATAVSRQHPLQALKKNPRLTYLVLKSRAGLSVKTPIKNIGVSRWGFFVLFRNSSTHPIFSLEADAEAFHKMLVSFGSLSEESPQGFAPGCMSQTTDRLLFDLPDALPRKIELPTDLFQRE